MKKLMLTVAMILFCNALSCGATNLPKNAPSISEERAYWIAQVVATGVVTAPFVYMTGVSFFYGVWAVVAMTKKPQNVMEAKGFAAAKEIAPIALVLGVVNAFAAYTLYKCFFPEQNNTSDLKKLAEQRGYTLVSEK